MLTRIEIDGFKTFRDFALDLPPFLVVLGRNGAGKSNLFDALRFLSRLAGEPLAEAAQEARGDLMELFHQDAEGNRMEEMRFAVEVVLNDSVTDAFHGTRTLPTSRLRYELTIELRDSRAFVSHEAAQALAEGGRYLDTRRATGEPPRFRIWDDAGRDPKTQLLAGSATASVLSIIGSASDSTVLYALKREMESWRHLHLDPAALRSPDSFGDPDTLGEDGAHLPNTLDRIVRETAREDRPEGLLGDISADLASVISDVSGVRIDEDDKRRRREVEFRARGGHGTVSARVASDGTLRADVVFLSSVSRIVPGQSRSRITQPRLIATGDRPSLADQEHLDPNVRLVSA